MCDVDLKSFGFNLPSELFDTKTTAWVPLKLVWIWAGSLGSTKFLRLQNGAKIRTMFLWKQYQWIILIEYKEMLILILRYKLFISPLVYSLLPDGYSPTSNICFVSSGEVTLHNLCCIYATQCTHACFPLPLRCKRNGDFLLTKTLPI